MSVCEKKRGAKPCLCGRKPSGCMGVWGHAPQQICFLDSEMASGAFSGTVFLLVINWQSINIIRSA